MTKDIFTNRHIGPREHEIDSMLKKVGVSSMEELINETIPASIRLKNPLNLNDGLSEFEYFNRIKEIAFKNKIFRASFGN